VFSKSAKDDQEIHDRLQVLKDAGIKAKTGSRNSSTDILVNDKDYKKSIDLLKNKGYEIKITGII